MSSSLLLHLTFLPQRVGYTHRVGWRVSAESTPITGIQFQVHDWFNHEAVRYSYRCCKSAKTNSYRATKHTTFLSSQTMTGPLIT
jgi:hypothetical protein